MESSSLLPDRPSALFRRVPADVIGGRFFLSKGGVFHSTHARDGLGKKFNLFTTKGVTNPLPNAVTRVVMAFHRKW